MSKRNRVFIGILLMYIASVAYVLHQIIGDLDSRYRESAEESMVETAHLLASWIEHDTADQPTQLATLGRVFQHLYAKQFSAQIYAITKQRAEMRVYVTDAQGLVIFDSLGRNEGQDFSRWRDVALTLSGGYGARTTRDLPDDARTSVMYVGAPIKRGDAIVGVVSVGKPVQSFGAFVDTARHKIINVGVSAVLAFVLLALIVSVWLVRPFGLVADYIRYVRAQRQFSLPRLGRRALGIIGAAYDEMRDALAGRHYTAEYVQTLTHEIKSPLSAIRGAAELLQEPLADEDRQRFLRNIQRESQRIQELIDRLLELSALETRRGLAQVETVDLQKLAEDALQAAQPAATCRDITLLLKADEAAWAEGDPFLLQRALANLLENAIDFSAAGGQVEIHIRAAWRTWRLHVRDHGSGIPDYALDRVFEKFYSLPRAYNQRKSTGLGLPFVREIAELHHGSIRLANAEGGGAEAVLELPRPRR